MTNSYLEISMDDTNSYQSNSMGFLLGCPFLSSLIQIKMSKKYLILNPLSIGYISDHEIPLAIGNRCAIFIYKIKYYNSWTTIHGL